MTSASEIEPGIRNREDFPHCCANRGVRYGRVRLNALNQIGLGRICRGPVWKSGLFKVFSSRVTSVCSVATRCCVVCSHQGVGFEGSASSRQLLGWAQGSGCWVPMGARGRTELDKHQEPDVVWSPLAHEVVEGEYPLALGWCHRVVALDNAH